MVEKKVLYIYAISLGIMASYPQYMLYVILYGREKSTVDICYFITHHDTYPQYIYPLEPQRRVFSTFDQNFDFKIRREHQKNYNERRAYELVDVRSLFRVI